MTEVKKEVPAGTPTQEASRNAVGRGPSYPAIDLEEAITRAKQFWGAEKRNSAPVVAASQAWGYSAKSSSGRLAVAALLQYGLLTDAGSKEDRTVKLTDRALNIVLDAPDSPNRLASIREAATSPKLHAEILSKWSAKELPSDQTLRYWLLRDKAFNEGALEEFMANFRASISYAKLDFSDIIPEEKPKVEPLKPPAGSVLVGDRIQWESNGVLQFQAPARVRAIQEHDGAFWVFVDGSQTGIAMSEITVLEKAQIGEALKAPPIFPIDELPQFPVGNEREWLRGPLSHQTNYRLIVSGDIGPKEIGKLIKVLEAQKAVYDDDEAA